MIQNVSNNDKEVADYIKKMKQVSFRNQFGELFNLHSNGIVVFMSGDEVNMMVDPKKTVMGYISLFNNSFNIWSADELIELGKALTKLGKLNMKERIES